MLGLHRHRGDRRLAYSGWHGRLESGIGGLRPGPAALSPNGPGQETLDCLEFIAQSLFAASTRPRAPAVKSAVPNMAAHLTCVACGTGLRLGANFCDTCGSSLAVTGTPAEFKQVTILFADVVNSMHVAAQVGTERFHEILTELVDLSASVVQRYGGTLDKFTGDGVMAVFGVPAALEDHALRGCLAALGIQKEAKRLAAEVTSADLVDLTLRIGLNSGEVIFGGIGLGPAGYTAVGKEVGMARRMESVAPPGAVMLSATTAKLVEGVADLGEFEWVQIKGAGKPVSARRLLGATAQRQKTALSELTLVGREKELGALATMLDRSIVGDGSVVGIAGPAGMGKTRLIDEVVQLATSRGVAVYSTFCEAHTIDVPFGAIARLLRAVGRISGMDNQTARLRMRALFSDADPEDMLLFDDLLGIADPAVVLPKIDPDARRRRLTALITATQLASSQPAVFVVEDAHWIDTVSESMLADFLAVTPRSRWLVLITYRPEYCGAFQRVASKQSINLPPLGHTETIALVAELLGPDPSVGAIGEIIAGRAAGCPFFAQEITRELAESGVLEGQRGAYICVGNADAVRIPATVQAAIAAQIDRLSPVAKRTLCAAAVIGSRFCPNLLESLGLDASVEELIAAELVDKVDKVDKVQSFPRSEYKFRHPLIHTVAYNSQLKSDRARLHEQLAAVIQVREPDSVDFNAAQIAEHLTAAGDLHGAYRWHMRAAAWLTYRDVTAAQQSWERARRLADSLPADAPHRAAMRIAPRTMLCGITWRVHTDVVGTRFDELRELCAAAGDMASLAIGMAGLVMDHANQDRVCEASQLASEAMGLIESIDDPTLTVAVSFAAIWAKMECADWCEVLRWSQNVIDRADGDASKGNILFGSPLAGALTTRGVARYWLGHSGWRNDLRDGVAMARNTDPTCYATVVAIAYSVGAIPNGVLSADDSAMREIQEAVRIAERSGDDVALSHTRVTLGLALVHRPTAAERDRGQRLLMEVGDVFLRAGHNLCDLSIIDIYLAREWAQRGDCPGALTLMRAAVAHLFREGRLLAWGVAATGVLVETLLDRMADGDVIEAEAAIERLASTPSGNGFRLRDVWLLRLRALLAQARGDETYHVLFDRYRNMAKSLGYEGHMARADAGRPDGDSPSLLDAALK